ncbi:MAG: TatD family deoxyribonuclease [Holophagales bacterium]|nr:TatD family deoxyribonuclease [Holophagales bacterium]MYG31269.1 TatD family deoxyribonuclease [Holophagales bacterium]MYI78863.1 TatD family deoxyribonuclease [Holophagales bacterium]
MGVASESSGLTDCHAHLCDGSFAGDLGEVLARAGDAGVGAVVAVGETRADAERNLELAEAYPGVVRPTAGLYPTHLDPAEAEQVADLIRRERPRLAAIGEVGLDRWKVRDERDLVVQREIFALFIDLSVELDLPLNVHSRSAGHHAIDLLRERGATRVQLHAFDGRAARAGRAVEAGYFFSVPPSVVRSPQKQKLVRRLPLSCLLLETDSPVLGPDRDQRNEPANAVVSLRAIAEIKALPVPEVAAAVRENTARLYG